MSNFKDALKLAINDRRLIGKYCEAFVNVKDKEPITFTRGVAALLGNMVLLIQAYCPPEEWKDVSGAVAEALRVTATRGL